MEALEQMKSLTVKSQIVLGQTGLLAGLLLVATFLGLLPDQRDASRESRAMLAEAIAANSAVFVSQADVRRLGATLRLVVDRNDDILSAAVRREEGKAVVTIGEHEGQWSQTGVEHSTDSQLQVPIWAGDKKWGQVELRFRPLVRSGWMGIASDPRFQLICYIVLSNLVVSSLYVSGMLEDLDPAED